MTSRSGATLVAGSSGLGAEEWEERSRELTSELGTGDRLAIVTAPAAATALAIRAARDAGAHAALIDHRLSEQDRSARLEASGTTLLFEAGRLHRLGPAGPSAADGGLVVYTSGTTQAARGTFLSWDALERSARGVVSATELGTGDRWLSPLPLSHVGGVGVLLRCLDSGATAELLEGFEAATLLERMRSGEVTHVSLVARMLDRVLALAPEGLGPSGLRWVLVGGGTMPRALIVRARRGGIPAVPTYGLTEAGSTVTLHRPGEELLAQGDAGWPLEGRRVQIADPGADGVGEILVGGETLASGYLGTTEAPLSLRDGWLGTGDFGRLSEDGRLLVVDRRSDLIVTGGENVSPSALEAKIGTTGWVDEVCVVGLPHPSWGQEVVAVLRPAASSQLPLESLQDQLTRWAAAELPGWERPKRWEFRSGPLPRNRLGKLSRGVLRKQLLDQDSGSGA